MKKSTVWLFYGILAAHSAVMAKLTTNPSNGDLRLAGYGATDLWGRLEVFLDGRWGTICDDRFTIKEAEVACRQMGLGYAVNYRANPLQRHGLTNSANHLVLSCNGNETHILNCDQIQITDFGICTHLEDVEIICSEWKPWPYSGEIRLVGGTSASEGYVEMYLNGEWGRICSDNMSGDEANVICRQLGYESALLYQPSSNGTRLNISTPNLLSTTWIDNNLNCFGNEVCLTSCLSSIPTSPLNQCSNEVGVRCTHDGMRLTNVGSKSACEVNSTFHDKSLRLVGGDAPNIGRLEILHNNEWGVMCFDKFGAAEGHVACRQLGYSVINNFASISINDSPLVHYYGADCRGTEFSLMDCNLIELTNQQCGVRGFVSIDCYDMPYPPLASVRMLGGSGPFGIVEVFNGAMWGPICDEHFDQADGNVMCRQLGFTGALHVVPNSYLGIVRDFLHITNITCAGNEIHLWECPFDNATNVKCDYYNQVAVHCGSNSSMLYGALRLTGGNGSMGRLEINLDGNWGTVCSQNFDMLDGHVACRQLGFKGVIDIHNVNESWTRMASHTVLLAEVDCQGYEDNLIYCKHDFGENLCTHNKDVLLFCDVGEPELDGRLRLVNGNSPRSGRLEIFKSGLWGTVCSTHFNKADADVACKQMGYNDSVEILMNFGGGSELPINLHEINCRGNESRLIDCEYEVYTDFYCLSSQNVAITCDVYCHSLPDIANGNITCTLRDDGVHSNQDTCSVTCNSGYVLTGSGIRTCLGDGTWSGTDGSCRKPQVYCHSLPDIANGNITCTLRDDGVHSNQDTCSVACNSGYILTGSGIRTCQGDGTWSGTDGSCRKPQVYCQPFAGIDNGTISCSPGSNRMYSHLDVCNFTCNSGYKLDGSDSRMCLNDGSWNGMDSVCVKEFPTPTTNTASDNSNIGETAGIIIASIVFVIGIITLVIFLISMCIVRRKHNKIPHEKFKNENGTVNGISYSTEGSTVDNITYVIH